MLDVTNHSIFFVYNYIRNFYWQWIFKTLKHICIKLCIETLFIRGFGLAILLKY